MSNYTPGPWTAVPATVAAQIDVMEIAEVSDMRVIPASGGWPTAGTPENDARLIAAATELLEALKLMQRRFLDTDGTHSMWEQEATDAARAAIAKATGEGE